MSDGFHNDYGGETIEELRIRENNPYLKAVTPSDIDKKLRLYNQSLSEPFKEITEEDYYDLLNRSRKSPKKTTMTCWMYCHPCA